MGRSCDAPRRSPSGLSRLCLLAAESRSLLSLTNSKIKILCIERKKLWT